MSWNTLAALTSALLAAVSTAVAAPAFPVGTGQTFRDAPWAPEVVVIPTGEVLMGASEAETQREGRLGKAGDGERPQHMIHVGVPLAVGKYEVTRAEFKYFMAQTGRAMTGGCMVNEGGVWGLNPSKSILDPAYAVGERNPATCVHWQDAQDYVHWLSKATGHAYRLLHEAEWEYAMRAGTTTARWWGDGRENLCPYLNGADLSFSRAYPKETKVDRSCDDSYVQTSHVDAFGPNPWGLYDSYGNVEQWLEDCVTETYANAPSDAEAVVDAPDCKARSVRGGTWHSDATLFRSANRGGLPITMRASSVGFRVVRLPD
jgi:formylglycine-generating enzyme required for sulfatase activity